MPSSARTPALGDEAVIQLVRIFGKHVLEQPDRAVALLTYTRPKGKDLVISGKECFIKTLVVSVAFLDVAEVPFSMESSGIPDVGKDLSDRDFRLPEPVGFQKHADVVHAVFAPGAALSCRLRDWVYIQPPCKTE